MNSRTALNLVLLAATLAIGAALYFKDLFHKSDAREGYAVVAERPENLVHIEIQRGREQSIVLERSGQRWRMKAPREARLDEFQLARVLEVARVHAAARLHADDLARFELDKPWAQIRFNQQPVAFGATNPLTHELYVHSGRYVYAVDSRIAAVVPRGAANLIAHHLFGPGEEPRAFALKNFSIRHDGMRWQLQPVDPNVSQDDLVRWVDQWRRASSIVTQPADAMVDTESVKIEMGDGRSVVLGILARSPELVLLRSDEMLQYHLPAQLAARLLVQPGTPAPEKR